jgi:hypothetical protein
MLTVQYAKAFPRWRVNAVTPGLTATEFAPSANAGSSVEEGANIIVRMATLGPDGSTGTFTEKAGTVNDAGEIESVSDRAGTLAAYLALAEDQGLACFVVLIG